MMMMMMMIPMAMIEDEKTDSTGLVIPGFVADEMMEVARMTIGLPDIQTVAIGNDAETAETAERKDT